MFVHQCPECACELEWVATDFPDTYFCPACETYWAVCPDCGNYADMDEYWNHEQSLCDDCAITDNEAGIQVISLSKDHSPEELHEFLSKIFGED
jgi:hypothetical protein